MLTQLVTALALILVIEGTLYALFPDGMKRLMVQVLGLPASNLRAAGLIATAAGVGIVWLLQG
ncbi:MAG: DUF2065 domain-containing protein [Alphaproteobacteria bacterium]